MLSPIEAIERAGNSSSDAKIDKAVVLYIHVEGVNYKCIECAFWKNKKCALYGPSVAIKEYGGCNLWLEKKDERELPWIGSLTKKETGYMENEDGFSCKRCDEFIPSENNCKKVNRMSEGDDSGKISKDGCCNRWEKK